MDTTGNWYVPPLRFLNCEVVDWAQPIVLTLASGGPLEVKVNQTVRMVEHSLGAVFWTWQDFVGQRKIAVGDLLLDCDLSRMCQRTADVRSCP